MRKLLSFALLLLVSIIFWQTHDQIGVVQKRQLASPTPLHKLGPASYYPSEELTPGDVLTTNESVVCASGYAGSVRNVSTNEKRQVYAEYTISYPQPKGSYEVDHFIPLELGGSNDIKNLWPEPANPQPGFHEKDVVENYLHNQVCSGKMSLAEAQKEIREDWYAVYMH